MLQDNLFNAVNKAEAWANIQESTYLNQRCLKQKQLLKMSVNFKDNQADKKAPQVKHKVNQANPSSETKKSFKKARKKKKKDYQG